mgnify:CR=1 FL=1
MHYDFKKKLNKVDSQQYRNFRVPEIDWVLNEAVEIFVKLIAKPRVSNHLGFEVTQRTRDDIRTIVQEEDDSNPIVGVNNNFQLPDDYWHHISSSVLMQKQGCTDRKAKVFIRQQDDEFETSPFDKSSFLLVMVPKVSSTFFPSSSGRCCITSLGPEHRSGGRPY